MNRLYVNIVVMLFLGEGGGNGIGEEEDKPVRVIQFAVFFGCVFFFFFFSDLSFKLMVMIITCVHI